MIEAIRVMGAVIGAGPSKGKRWLGRRIPAGFSASNVSAIRQQSVGPASAIRRTFDGPDVGQNVWRDVWRDVWQTVGKLSGNLYVR